MAADALRVQVLFSAIDRLTGPLKGMKGGAGGLKGALSETRKEILALEKAQGRAGAFRKAESDYRRLGGELKAARLEAKAAKLELQAAEKPTAALAKAADRAAAAEAKAGAAYHAQGEKLQRLGNELERAGVDMTRLIEHEDSLALKTYEANKRLEQQTQRLEKLERQQARAAKVQAVGNKIAGVGGAMSLGVTLPAIMFAKQASAAANESRQATAAVEASLASMGNKAGRTLEQLQAQAGKLQSTSLFDDDDIMRKLTTNLLTFGNVSGKVFDRAQQAAVDMSAKLGQDLQSSAMQLGKALNDPAKGVNALRRVGVSFSAEQVEMIKKLDKTGQRAKAQAIILAELEKQFKGSAAAARKADPNAASAEQWRTFQENVGAIVNKTLPLLNNVLEKALGAFNAMPEGMQQTIVAAVAIVAALGPVLLIVGKLISGLGAMRGAWIAWRAAQAGSAAAGALSMGPLLIVVAIAAAIGVAAYLIWKHWDKIKAAFSAGVAFVSSLGSRIAGAVGSALAFLGSLPARFGQLGANLIQGLIRGVLGKLSALRSAIVGVASSAANWFKSKLGIRSPSRVFMGFGANISEGLQRGIAAGEGSAVRRVDRLSSRVAGAFAASSLIASPALASSGTAPSSASSSSAATAAAPAQLGPITIQIVQQPGQSADELAKLVAAELAKLQASTARSSYNDDE